ncbi:hypothetical protein NBRC116598_27030 [Pseudophaeobacter arcticus]|uniref:Uncharacterized protein n=1 Tax=Pseudophaeobacter arcticus TaxID=385492 RepID=A0ABQ0AN44_9RHOB
MPLVTSATAQATCPDRSDRAKKVSRLPAALARLAAAPPEPSPTEARAWGRNEVLGALARAAGAARAAAAAERKKRLENMSVNI